MKFSKYHALGNSYIVIGPEIDGEFPSELFIQKICNRNYGVASDGLLVGPLPSSMADFALRIFNPDASEAEKSGNGLRIFCRYLWDCGLVGESPFTVETKGGLVRAQVARDGASVEIEMGAVSFISSAIPVIGRVREVLRENIEVAGRRLIFSAASIGNPHCVVVVDDATEKLAREVGPLLEVNPMFPQRTNVQFVQILSRTAIKIEIWERGAGYTLASGSSSCASAAVVYRLGLCDKNIAVNMPGGQLQITIDAKNCVTMNGPVAAIAAGDLSVESFSGGLLR